MVRTLRHLALVPLIGLAACGGSHPKATPTPTPVVSTPTPDAAAPVAVVMPEPVKPAPPAVNPLLTKSTLYLQAPPFDQIREEHYMPAFTQGMAEHDAEVRAIADATAPATFDNTIVALEKSGQTLTRVSHVFFQMAQSTTNPNIQKIEAEIAPLLAKHMDGINLDPKLFARVHELFQKRAKLGLDAVDVRLLERYHLDFVRGGANLSDADKTKFRALNEEASTLTTKFSELVLKDTNASAVVVDDVKQLDGMSESDIA
ncbi:MAG: dipeptidyl carboxypeptidase II, partial [Proteobacteria bacterium]|nr:dipeptidyl carboxypeptidase II [Pseudomonadota bacterium]